jgi:hypothetical protein
MTSQRVSVIQEARFNPVGAYEDAVSPCAGRPGHSHLGTGTLPDTRIAYRNCHQDISVLISDAIAMNCIERSVPPIRAPTTAKITPSVALRST